MCGGQSHTRVRLQNISSGRSMQQDFTLSRVQQEAAAQHNICTVMRSREPSQAKIGHAFGPYRQWFLSMHTNQGYALASGGNKHSPGRTCHVSGDCTQSPCSTLAMAPVHLACLRLSLRLFVLQEICVTELFWKSVMWSISDFILEPPLVQSFSVSNKSC